MNMQEVFDKVSAHLLKQNARSVACGINSTCSYRGEEGRMCAVGCLIPDELYRPSLEGWAVWQPAVNSVLGQCGIDVSPKSPMRKMLTRLQSIHDNESVGLWRNNLIGVAEEFGLAVHFGP